MMNDVLINPGIAVAGGLIVPATEGATVTIDATGLDILPGFIDVHGDAFERALSPRPGVMLPIDIALAELEALLLAAGVTTAYLAVTLSWEAGLRSADTYRHLRDALRRRPLGAVPDLRLHVRFEAHNLAALDLALEDIAAGDVHMLSFNDHTPGIVRKLPNPAAVAKIVERAGQSYEDFCADARRAGDIPLADIAAGRNKLGAAARQAGIPIASHDDTTPEERAAFRALGARISEFPTTVEVARDAIAHGEPTVMGAPNVVRGGSHTGWHGAEALVQAGFCSVLCSDYHYPSMLHAIYRIARNGSAGFAAATDLITKNAAALAGLTDRGTLTAGQRADIVLVAPSAVPKIVAVVAGGKLAYLAPEGVGRVSTTFCEQNVARKL
jgi:alpha-D-ribose 1-methylphosphonate 5-triphosphate diphosphatase